MYIKSIVIDGFKSYGQRTEITGFDPEFNAITGLNGSGKSNILDAICFLLGITNLSCVRATNLQELVYKNGQAGVSKATVTILFDNRDKSQSPMGYEQHEEVSITRQVVIGGKNKYLLNGSNVQNQRVQDFFRSVQLNVNNPHFLIMQGRITKVLNMKPPEILAMIEEAAGTMLYESKKQNAEKTIAKKDSKLREINGILDEEITPTLNKLKEERATYFEFQKIQREHEHLHKLVVAWKFVNAEQKAKEAHSGLEGVNEELENVKQQIVAGNDEIVAIQKRIEDLQRQRDEELGGKLQELENDQKVKEKNLVQIETSLKSTKDNMKQEERKQKQTEKGMNSDKKVFEAKTAIVSGLQVTYDKLRETDERCQKELKDAQTRYEAISVGKFSTEDGKADTLQQQIIKLKQSISNAQTTVKTHDMKMKHNDKELKKLEAEKKKFDSELKRDSANLKKFEDQVQAVEKELSGLKYQEGTLEDLEEKRRNLKHEVQGKGRALDQMKSRMPWINFHYSDPERNFDRTQVRGVAAALMRVKDEKFFVALDNAAGGKLFNVIVDTAAVASKILKYSKLQRRAVLLPLDKMVSKSVVTPQMLKSAQELVGKNNVWRAIDLIEFEKDLRPAMEHILGSVIICNDMDSANILAYDKRVSTVCVTLEGDVVNSFGQMSGGAPPAGGSKLAQISGINDASYALKEVERQLEVIDAQLKKVEPLGRRYNQLKDELDIKTKELQHVRERLSHSDAQRTAEDARNRQEENNHLKQEVLEATKVEKEGKKKVEELEYKIKNAKQLKEKELKDADAAVKKCKKAVEASKKEWSQKEAEEKALKGEVADLEKSIKEAEEQIQACLEAIKGYAAEVEKLTTDLNEAQEAVGQAKQVVKAQKDAVAKNNKEINMEGAKSEKIKKLNSDRDLKVQELHHKISKASSEVKDSAARVAQLLEKYEWIAVDKKFFGESGSAYDFDATDPEQAEKRLKTLQENMKKLEETVNMRAMTMLDKAEMSYAELMRKKATVENDKAKIKKVIEKLDVKKKEELRKAYEKVNLDFGTIFSSLLPGTEAKLRPPEGMDVLDGLEVKIAFGGIWKESLSELSGGQRSLVALSLILSLLRFKPAPLYILDEVDAALDLSHTQNIGNMLKQHFQNSQFIVVSLKDGMFNNANVLFRTKFVDGMSTVSRSTQGKK